MRQPDWQTADGAVRLFLGDCLELLPQMEAGSVDAVVTDPPYSERTHKGHDASAAGNAGEGNDGADRRSLGYSPWGEQEIAAFVPAVARACSGWIVCMTDHSLAPLWGKAFGDAGRYVFAPLPYYAPGSRVRLSGDGPSSWTDWIVVSRTAAQLRWGTLPGGYTKGPHYGEHLHMGGKPVGLMLDLVGHYSRSGHIVCDPCFGGCTTGIACIRTGRRFIGIEKEERYFNIAVKRIQAELNRFPLLEKSPDVIATKSPLLPGM